MSIDVIVDLDYYCWRERVMIDGEERLLIPWSDPHVYEYPWDAIYSSAEEAIRNKNTDDVACLEDWVLVHYHGTIVERVDPSGHPFEGADLDPAHCVVCDGAEIDHDE